MLQRLLVHRAEQRVVDGDRRPVALLALDPVDRGGNRLQVDQTVGRVGRGLQHDQADAALGHRIGGGGVDLGRIATVREADRLDAERRQLVADQGLGAAIERAAVQDGVAGPQERQHGGGDRGHAAGEHGRALGLVPDRETVLQDFEVRVVEARIDQPRLLALVQLAPAGGEVEEILALLRGLEHESRGQEDRRLERTLGQGRRVAQAHHQGLGMELAAIHRAALVLGRLHDARLRCAAQDAELNRLDRCGTRACNARSAPAGTASA